MNTDLILFPHIPDAEVHAECIRAASVEVINALTGFEFPIGADRAPTKLIKDHLTLHLSGLGWQKNQQVNQSVPLIFAGTNFKTDFTKLFRATLCGKDHQVSIELAADNRQVIGTNLLKLEVSSREYEAATGNVGFGFVICPGHGVGERVGWDKAVADSSEYENAIRVGYGNIFQTGIELVVIR